MTTKQFRLAVESFRATGTTIEISGEWRNGVPDAGDKLKLTKAGVEYTLNVNDVQIGSKYLELVLTAGKAQDVFTKSILKPGDILVGVPKEQ